MMNGNHFVEKCVHGTVQGQCRCPAPNKTIRIVACGPECPTTNGETP